MSIEVHNSSSFLGSDLDDHRLAAHISASPPDSIEAHWLILGDRWYKAQLRRSRWRHLWAREKQLRCVRGKDICAVVITNDRLHELQSA